MLAWLVSLFVVPAAAKLRCGTGMISAWATFASSRRSNGKSAQPQETC
jgi:hypothetical protein